MGNRKDLVFHHMCLVGRMEKWKNEKLICLVEKKNENLEKVVCFNLLLCSYYVVYKK